MFSFACRIRIEATALLPFYGLNFKKKQKTSKHLVKLQFRLPKSTFLLSSRQIEYNRQLRQLIIAHTGRAKQEKVILFI